MSKGNKSWSQLVSNEPLQSMLPIHMEQLQPHSSKNNDNIVSLDDIMSEQLAVEICGDVLNHTVVDSTTEQLILPNESVNEFLKEAGLAESELNDFVASKYDCLFKFFSPLIFK